MNIFGKISKETLILASVTFTAAVVRIMAAFMVGSYNYDEMFSVYFSSKPLSSMLSLLSGDIHPPFYYIVLHFWQLLFTNSEIATRTLSTIFSTASVFLLFRLAKYFFTPKAALWSALIFALSPYQVFVGVEARMYSLVGFLGLLSFLLFFQVFLNGNKKLLIYYLFVNLILVFTSLGGLFVVATEFLWFGILYKNRASAKRALKPFILAQLVYLIPWSLWFVFLLLPQLSYRLGSDWFYVADIEGNVFSVIYDFFFLYLQEYGLRFISSVLIFVSPFMLLLWNDRRINIAGHNIHGNWLLFAWLLPGLSALLIFALPISRLYAMSLLSLYVMLGFTIELISRYSKKSYIIVSIAWLAISVFSLWNLFSSPLNNWQGMMAWAGEKGYMNDLFVVSCFVHELQFEHYNSGISDHAGLYLSDDLLDRDKRIIQKSCMEAVSDRSVAKLDELLGEKKRIIVSYEFQYPDRFYNSPLYAWLRSDSWHLRDAYDPMTKFGPKALLFVKYD